MFFNISPTSINTLNWNDDVPKGGPYLEVKQRFRTDRILNSYLKVIKLDKREGNVKKLRKGRGLKINVPISVPLYNSDKMINKHLLPINHQ